MSVGVLQERYLSLFEPELPAIKVNAINGLTLGTVDKIYLEFAKPFWRADWEGISFLWTKDDQNAIRNNPNNNWLEDIFGFYTVDCQPNILCGWISGVNARRMELLPEHDVAVAVTGLLRKFIKKWNIPDPIRVNRTQWYSNPHFRGSYSFRSLKTDLLKTSAAQLAIPITNALGQPILQFAGEATNDHYYSTVHGAIEAGWREAKRITDFYK